ncbi:glucose-specific PTS transporter subunit IIBC [Clostridiaceae bacterium M8S5]|nr:glucose-specific PTS transporter subunit IIBC [Clostridiaceae bacterium M8S5]
MMKKAFGVLQQIGKALMLPVALLPAAGIILALGATLQNPFLLDKIPVLGGSGFQLIAKLMFETGGIVFGNLPLLFAIGVAVGLSGGEGVAGIAATIGYLIMNVTMGVLVPAIRPDIAENTKAFTEVLGISTLQTGVFGGIIIGIIAASLYKKYYNIELPPSLGFFAGKRFVPIITAVSSIILGAVMMLIWPYIQGGLDAFSRSMINANRTLAAFIFGVIERALIPFGLHHIFYSPFWFEFGEYVTKAGDLVRGDQTIFFKQLIDGVPFTAGTFMTGKFAFMMFGLPGAALAMYHEARPEKKKLVAGIMASAALTSFLTGITEPLEFTFLFVAPVLFAVHCVFAGLSFMTMQLLNIKIGMTFSGGVIDFILFGVLPNRTPWYLVIPVGIVFFIIYYFGFRFVIRKWNIKTPGRETDEVEITRETINKDELAKNILQALGGKQNISKLDSCITRLRISVNDIKEVDKSKLKSLGASGVLEVGNNIQAIFGTRSDQLKTQMKNIINNQDEIVKIKDDKHTIKGKEKFVCPVTGTLLELKDVPDQVFSDGMMGEGFAINPSNGDVVSPVNGEVTTVFPTKHAIGITSENGYEVLIHFGIDTVNLKGEGFESLVTQGESIKAGQSILKVDIDKIKDKVPSLITPIIITNLPANESIKLNAGEKVEAGKDDIIKII